MNLDELNQNAQLLAWHQELWQRLLSRYPQLGHGLLFFGKPGCGKQKFAGFFAKWLLCKNKQAAKPCNHCSSCLWVAAGTHPQLKLISPEFDEKKQSYSAIKIDQIRELNSFIQQTVEGWRIVIIYPAENLNIAAANALLKTLEEPGERVLLLLLSDAMLKLPATIRSRVQHYALDRISLADAQHYLSSHQLDAQKAQIALNLSADMPLKAQQLLASESFARREEFFLAWLQLIQEKAAPIKFSSFWLKVLDLKAILALISYTLLDCIAHKLEQPIKQVDLNISELAKFYNLQQLFAISEQINKIHTMLMQNVQNQQILDDLSIRLMNVSEH